MKLSTSIITKSLLALLLVAGLPGPKAHAQEEPTITVTIPFSFWANNRPNIPAGTYQINLLSDWLLSIRNIHSLEKQIFQVRPEQGKSTGSHGCLVFDRFDGHNYLAEVHLTGSKFYTEMMHRYRTTDKAMACTSGSSAKFTPQ
ncbi:MAG TPA: hypothetical protein VGU67_11825 [Edaphobacter sp.]|nr:hypothetical protein [Edaphobacter sp.]